MALRDHVTLRGFSSQRKSAADDEAEQHFSTRQSSAQQQTGSSCSEPLCNLNTNLSLTTTCAVQAAETPVPIQPASSAGITHTQPGMHSRAADRVNTDDSSE